MFKMSSLSWSSLVGLAVVIYGLLYCYMTQTCIFINGLDLQNRGFSKSSAFLVPPPSIANGLRANIGTAYNPSSRPTPYCTNRASKHVLKSSSHTLDGRPISGALQTLGDRLLALPKEPIKKTAGGLLLPSDMQARLSVAKVLSVNDHYINDHSGAKIPIGVKVGDGVLYDSNDGQELNYDGEDCLLLGSREVLAIIKSESLDPTPDNITPMFDMVLVKLDDNKDTTSSGLVLSMGDKVGCFKGSVVARGEGAYDINGNILPMGVSVGDKVRLGQYAYRGGDSRADKELRFNDDKYIFVRVSDIVAKWN